MDEHFDDTYPNGVTIGCATNYYTFTSPDAVGDFLPNGGPSASMSGQLTDPTDAEGGAVVGQLLAATLNLGFGPTLGSSSCNAAEFSQQSGICFGYTPAEIVGFANQYLGGCGTSGIPETFQSASNLNTCLTAFNENYDNGNTDNGNLDTCVNNF
jgi:hypothetical protein